MNKAAILLLIVALGASAGLTAAPSPRSAVFGAEASALHALLDATSVASAAKIRPEQRLSFTAGLKSRALHWGHGLKLLPFGVSICPISAVTLSPDLTVRPPKDVFRSGPITRGPPPTSPLAR
ncbi:MAG TPA: hypothetical protein VGK99_10285 [Acidobacteriota bacterium]